MVKEMANFIGQSILELIHTGDIYVTDTYNNSIERFDKNFTFITKWGSKGTADGQFKLPHAIGFDSKGNVYVDELERPGVQVFDKDGKFLRKWGTVGTANGLAYPKSTF